MNKLKVDLWDLRIALIGGGRCQRLTVEAPVGIALTVNDAGWAGFGEEAGLLLLNTGRERLFDMMSLNAKVLGIALKVSHLQNDLYHLF